MYKIVSVHWLKVAQNPINALLALLLLSRFAAIVLFYSSFGHLRHVERRFETACFRTVLGVPNKSGKGILVGWQVFQGIKHP